MNKKRNNKCIFCNSKRLSFKNAFFVNFLVERMFLNNPPKTSLVICKKCNFKYSKYRPTDEEMARLYKDYRGEKYQKQRERFEPFYKVEFNKNLGHNKEIEKIRKARISSTLAQFADLTSIESVLDYGGDEGQFIPETFINAKKYSYDISNIPTVDGVENISNKEILFSQKYQFVMCNHVLEHVSYPQEIIKELHDLTQDNGFIYIEVPYEDVKGWKHNNSYYIHEHIQSYTLKILSFISKIFKDLIIMDIVNKEGVLIILLQKKKVGLIERLKNQREINKRLKAIEPAMGLKYIIRLIKKLVLMMKMI